MDFRGCDGADPGVHGTSDKEPLLSGWDACGPEIETEVGSSFAAAAASSSQEERAAKSNRASNGSSLGLSPQLSQSSLEVIQEKQRSASRSWRGSLRVLIIGWVEDTFMMETIHEMDHGLVSTGEPDLVVNTAIHGARPEGNHTLI